MVEPLPRLYNRHYFLVTAGVYKATIGAEFCTLIANFSSKPVYITEGQIVEKAKEHLATLMESTTITHG